MLDAKILIAGTEIPVGHAMLEKLIEAIPDETEYERAMQQLAAFGSTKVQEAIASRESIDPATVQILLRSREVNVLRPLLCNPRGQEALTPYDALRIANSKQPELLEVLAWNIGEFSLCSPSAILERFAADRDPWVRMLVIDRQETSAELLEKLSHDVDPDVQRAAKKALEERNVDLLQGDDDV